MKIIKGRKNEEIDLSKINPIVFANWLYVKCINRPVTMEDAKQFLREKLRYGSKNTPTGNRY